MADKEVYSLPLRPKQDSDIKVEARTAEQDPAGEAVGQASSATPEANDTAHPETDNEAGEEDGDRGMIVTDPADLPPAKKKKKRKSKKTAGQRGLGKPTGMEEFFADAPMTPEEYAREKSLYDPEIPFLDRLLTAIQRFERTRKLANERRDIFYKWLHYGSIKVGPNVGTGAQNVKEMNKEETAEALSQVAIPFDVRENLETTSTNEPKYAVDFIGCMKGFLSRAAPAIYAFDNKEAVKLVTSTLERFLDFLMQHDVCPEYNDDILQTRNFAREAACEMWSCAEAQRWLPGQFNIACSTLFDGQYGRDYDGETYWGDMEKAEGDVFVGHTKEEATQIFGFAMAGAASQDMYENYIRVTRGSERAAGLQVVKVIEDQGFEIVDLEAPTADCKDLYKNNGDKYRPMGRVTAKPWRDPDAPAEDLTDEEKAAAEPAKESAERYEFFMEEIIMQHLSVGQKVLAKIHQVNCGIWFFDEFTRIYADFDMWLFNEMVEDYKEPRWLNGAYAPGAPDWEAAQTQRAVIAEGGADETTVLNSQTKLADGENAREAS